MKYRLGSLLVTLSVVALAPFVSAAQPLDDAKIQVIRENCKQAQSTMQRIQRSGSAVRINRGQSYENTTKLLTALNSRAVLNSYSIPDLVESAAGFETEFTAFKSAYFTYEKALGRALEINCTGQPVTFYDALETTREKRALLAETIDKMNAQLDKYQGSLDSFEQEIKKRTEAGNL